MEHIDVSMRGLLSTARQAAGSTWDGQGWRCQCGAELDGDAVRCSACVAASMQKVQEENLRRQVREHIESLDRMARRPLESAPKWDHAIVGTPAFAEKVRPRLRGFAEKYSVEHGSVALLGPSGVGKTSAAIALLRRLAEEALKAERARRSWEISREFHQWSRTRWIDGLDLASAKRNHPLGQGEPPLIVEAKAAPLLVIDELGWEPANESLFEVTQARYVAKLPTIITSSLDSGAFCQRYGAPLFRRLTDRGVGRVVEVGGTDGG